MSTTQKKHFFGHPFSLSTLFMTEMWERFSYYGMRAILTLFLMAAATTGGFGLSEEAAYSIYGVFTAFVYITPIFGGILADKILGQRKTIFIGGIVMAVGQFLLFVSATPSVGDLAMRQTIFYIGLTALILGNGFFKPNISTMVGDLYDANDSRRDGGFTLFYMGINLGALLAPFIAGSLGEGVAWHWGFFTAGVGMLIGTLWFFFTNRSLGEVGLPPKHEKGADALTKKGWGVVLMYILISLALAFGVILIGGRLSESVIQTITYTAGLGLFAYLMYSIIKGTTGKTEWGRVAVILILCVFNVFFWSGFEQAGTTFTSFAKHNLDRDLLGIKLPASIFQSINPIFILILAPIFSVMWTKLAKVKLNPNTPLKFVIGMMALSLGFVVMAIANDISTANPEDIVKVSPLWLISVYLIHTCGELCLSPIGLSMITKLSPAKLTSTMMGLWLGSTAGGNYVASQMKSISNTVNESLETPISVFWFIAIETAIASLLLLILVPWLKKMMKGVE